MRAVTATMFIVATGVSSIGLSGSTPAAVSGHSTQHSAPSSTRAH
jgi:hypothetical protein